MAKTCVHCPNAVPPETPHQKLCNPCRATGLRWCGSCKSVKKAHQFTKSHVGRCSPCAAKASKEWAARHGNPCKGGCGKKTSSPHSYWCRACYGSQARERVLSYYKCRLKKPVINAVRILCQDPTLDLPLHIQLAIKAHLLKRTKELAKERLNEDVEVD